MKTRLFLFLFIVAAGFGWKKQDVVVQDYKTLGSSAHDLLSSASYNSLVVQFDCMPGYQPDATTLSNLQSFLESRLNKPNGVQLTVKSISPSGKTQLSIDDVVSLEKQYRTEFTQGTKMAVHVLVSDADYTTSNVIGISYWNTSICLFGATLSSHSSGLSQSGKTRLWSSVIEHEFGHLLGLVDQGSPMQTSHKDTAHGAHCTNSNCLMYYGIESSSIINLLSTVPPLDANCINDLRANGGK
jgi:predicted Zn-dependent protease